jgi:pimeloyl-ACP methyl ester carboxylesterase
VTYWTDDAPRPYGPPPQGVQPQGTPPQWSPYGPPPRRHPVRRVIITIAVVVALVAAIVGAVAIPRAVEAATMARFTAAVDWQDCGDGNSCARIDAPLDWSNPWSKPIHLALIEHRATGTKTGTLLVNPGGPGGSGVDMVASDVRNAVTADVAEHTDVIGFDPRGVGHSTAVDCGGASTLDDYLYPGVAGAVGSDAWVRAERAAAKRFAAACAEHSGDLLQHVDTMSAARDLELIRRDLGEDRLDYLGYSYGTELGSVYAGMYPHHVGRFVLDGAVDLWSVGSDDDGSGDAGFIGQARGFETALRDWMRACVGGATSAVPAGAVCPYSGSVDAGMAAVRTLLDTTSTEPLEAADGRRLDGTTLATGITSALYDERDWPHLTTALAQATAGDPTGAFALADQYNERGDDGRYDSNATEAFIAIGCVDAGGVGSVSAMRREAAKLRKAAPTLGPYQAYDFTCDGWAAQPVTAYPDAPTDAGDGPVVVVGTTKDPATPYSDAKSLADLFPDGHLVTEVGEGHTAYNLDDPCVDRAVDAYLLHGTVPARDPRCGA